MSSLTQSVYRKWNAVSQERFIRQLPGRFASIRDRALESQQAYRISEGTFTYTYLNMCFLKNVLGLVAFALYQKRIPVIDIRTNNSEALNLWELFFLQPLETADSPKPNTYSVESCPETTGPFPHDGFDPYSDTRLRFWSCLFHHCVRLNPKTSSYVEEEKDEIFGHDRKRRVLGVLCRGTDYTTTKPKHHPVQPEIPEVIDLARIEMDRRGLEFLYLATEELRIVRQFESAFPGKVLTNKREYYDDIYYNEDGVRLIGEVYHGRENEDYLKGLEYLSSILILSQCQSLIGGNCGGSAAALYFNNFSYEYWHLFNLGRYGVDDSVPR